MFNLVMTYYVCLGNVMII